MKKELELQLVERHPKMMKNYCGNKRETCFAFGFEHDDGWYELIDTLCCAIQRYADYNISVHKHIVVDQIKEKFGGLRFYYTGGDDYITGLVSFAETMSYHICEKCGTNQNAKMTRRRGWMKTLCETCEIERNKNEQAS